MIARRLPLRFSLRTIFVAIAINCLWLGWNLNTVHTRRKMRAELESRGTRTVEWFGIGRVELTIPFVPEEIGPISWIRRKMGDKVISVIHLPSTKFSVTNYDVIQDTFPEAELVSAGIAEAATSGNGVYE